ncbi:MAG: type IV pili methyl-accepting chemotaxis transducer N-terminal domain-containing protein [Chloroflexi bacterium]|nr:type IV pili methyl-accepting chemotaxis transducer N-terminal domain-containing protein [Chloroflexota bacterium]
MIAPPASQQVARRLTQRYSLALFLILLLSIAGQALIQLSLTSQASDSRVVNVSGRQRMLSQRLSKTALALQVETGAARDARVNELEFVLNLWSRSHEGLQSGDAEIGVPGNNSDAVNALFEEIEPNYQAMLAAGRCLQPRESGTAPAGCESDPTVLVSTILANEPDFLTGMDAIVFQYDAEAAARVGQLRTIELILLAVTIVVLALEAVFVFRPITQQISIALNKLVETQRDLQAANETLEHRVEERTSALAQSNSELKAANDEIQAFAGLVSHDLRSPIAALKGYATELRRDLVALQKSVSPLIQDPAVRELLDQYLPESVQAIEQAALTMERLTKAILRLSREGYRDLTWTIVNSNDLVRSVIADFATEVQARGIEIEVAPLPVINADEPAVEHTFRNLISNAIKYSDPKRPAKIRIRAKQDGKGTTFQIEDNGIGIPEYDHSKVFSLFGRGSMAKGLSEFGEGVGLHFVRMLIQRHGGSIDFQSHVGVGTTFSFTIPNHVEVPNVA